MRITGVEVIAIEIPLTRNFGGSRYNVMSRCTIITRMTTDTGLVSEVYNGDNRTHLREIVAIVEDELAPLVIGEEVHAVERIWKTMFAIAEWNRDRKLVMEAIACVDAAIWDLMGKAAGVNVCRLMGGYRQELPIISIAGYYVEGKTLADLGDEMAWLRTVGMAGCKMKVGGLSAEADAERVAAARAGAGPDFLLAVDANRGWPLAEAVRFARLIERHDIAWFEEPCHWYDDARMMAEVRRATSIPVNAGQSEASAAGVRRLVDAHAVDIVNFDASEAGGLTEWRRAAAYCALNDVRLAHHDPVWAGLIANRPTPVAGTIPIPQGPGFGLELDWDLIARYRLN